MHKADVCLYQGSVHHFLIFQHCIYLHQTASILRFSRDDRITGIMLALIQICQVIMLSDTNLPEAGSSETHRPAAEFALPSEHASESLENEIAHSFDLSPRLANT